MRYLGMVFAAAVSCAVGVFASAGARADVVRTYDFSGTLVKSFNGDDSVTGFFVLDQTTGTLDDFSFKTPVFTFDPATSTGSAKAFTGVSPNADFVSVSAFNSAADASIALLFETTFLNFNGNTFFTEGVALPGETTFSGVTTLSPIPFLSFFASGAAAPIPEPSTWAMMLLGFGGLGFLGYRQTRGAKPQAA